MRMSGISTLLVITTLLVAGSDALWRRVVRVSDKLQALVYDILHRKEGAGKRCSVCG